MAQEPGNSPLSVNLPKGGGDIRGLGDTFVPDYNRGTASYQLPLQLPPGRAGFQPALTLAYNSGAANGVFGIGWSLGIPKISRDGERGFVAYDANDTFLLDGHGQLVRLPDGTYRPKIDALFADIRLDTGWELRRPDNTVERYGKTAQARVFDPASPSRVLAWALEASEDRNGNLIQYHYKRDGNNLYLTEIAYAIYRVVLVYEERPDKYGTSRHGFPIETRRRCRRLEIHSSRVGANTLIRSYTLLYTTPAETPISMLSEIIYSGHRFTDGVEEIESLPPLRFGYSRFEADQPRLRALSSEPGFPPPPVGTDGTELVDFTGDGLPDLLQLRGIVTRYFRNRGDGSWDRPRTLRNVPAGVDLDAPGSSFADMNGDGIADIIVTQGARPGFYPLLGKGRFDRYRAFDRTPDLPLSDANTRQIDLDADGIVDVLHTGNRAFVSSLREGKSGWSQPRVVPRLHDPEQFPDVFFADPGVHLADMTGDGLSDIVLVHSGEVCYWPYEGLLRWGARRRLEHAPAFPRGYEPGRIFLADVNGDGVADLLLVDTDSVTVWINQFGERFSDPLRFSYTPLLSGAAVRMADMFGRGTLGVLWSYAASQRHPDNYLHLSFTGDTKPYLLTHIDNGRGGQIEISYETSTRHAARDRSNGRPWPTLLPFPVQVVSSVKRRDAAAGKETLTKIQYHDGMYGEHRFAGFGQVAIEDVGDASGPGVLTEVAFDQSPVEELTEAARAAAMARWGRLLVTTQRAVDTGEVLRRATNSWDTHEVANGEDGTPVIVVHKAGTTTESFGGSEGPLVIDQTFTFDDHGNIIRSTLRANGATPLERRTEISYTQDAAGRVLSLPSRIIEKNGSDDLVREYRFYFDGPDFIGLPLGSVSKGNVSRQSVRVLDQVSFDAHYGPEGLLAEALGYRQEDGAVFSDSGRYAFNLHGQITAALTPQGDHFDVEYDADGIFPIKRTDPKLFAVTFTWDYHALQPKEIVNPNGARTQLEFDPLGRVIKLALPNDDLSDPSEHIEYDLGASPPGVRIDAKLTHDGPRAVRHTYYQADGTLLETRLRRDATSVLISPKRTFNARGWVASEGQPELGTSLAFAPRPGLHPSSLRYDALGRIVEVTYANGKLDRTQHEPFRTVHYDANDTDESLPAELAHFFDTPRVHRYDGFGRIVAVTELHDGLVTTHAYGYDDAGNLTTIRAPNGKTLVRQTYDLAGNRLRLEHRDAGERRLYYAADGKVVRAVDAEGNRVTRTYDALGREMTTEVNGEINERLTYDDASRSNQRGRLSEVKDLAGTWTFDYDSRGRLLKKTLERPHGRWTLDFDYHPSGPLHRVRYPDGGDVLYEYNQAGLVSRVPGYVEAIHYDARGRRTLVHYSNQVRTELEYDAQTAFLKRQTVRGPLNELLEEWQHTRDNVGNLISLVDGRGAGPDAPHPRRFGYDARYRLLEVHGGDVTGGVTPYTRHYRYDQGSNFTELPAHAGQTLFYDPIGSSRLAGVIVGATPQRLYDYDKNGNLVRLPARDFVFDAFSRLVKVTRDDGRECTYEYNVAGERTWRRSNEPGEPWTVFLSDLYEEEKNGNKRRTVFAGDLPVAVEEGTTRRYLHPNELGHTLLETGVTGAVTRRLKHHPFGELHSASGFPIHDGFSGKRFDHLSGCYFFGARHYLPEIGRFITPDPLLLWVPERGLVNTQLHHLYAYANNNPATFIDPFGYSLWGAVAGGLAGGFVGGVVFVVTGGNPILAGIAGGFAGGFVSGWIDSGSLKGAVIGGVLGAAAGFIGGGALWGASALGGIIGGYLGQEIATSCATGVFASLGLFQALQGMATDNWDIIAGMAAGIAGAHFGRMLGNSIMMRGVWSGLKNSPRVRNTELEAERKLGNRVSFQKVKYQIAPVEGGRASHDRGTITFDREDIGNSYLDLRHTHAHELRHEYQEQTIPNFGNVWSASVKTYGDEMNNPYQIDAENFAMRFFDYRPYPFECYVYVVGPVATATAMPAAHEDRKRGENAWEPLL